MVVQDIANINKISKNPGTSADQSGYNLNICKSIDIIFHEKDYTIEKEIAKLKPSSPIMNDYNVRVKHHLLFTMIDGEVCNAVASVTSSQRCYLCKATSKDFNNLENIVKLPIDVSSLQFGLSTLHSWIRFFETILHLSYKLEIKKSQVRKKKT